MQTTTLNLGTGETKVLSVEWLNSVGIVTPTPGRNLSWRIAQTSPVVSIGLASDTPPGDWLIADTCNVTSLTEGQAIIIAAANFNPPERPFPKTEFASLV